MRRAKAAQDHEPALIAETAAQWFARRRQGLKAYEDAEFRAWLEERSEHRRAYEAVVQAWEIAGAVSIESRIAAMRSEALILRPNPTRRRRLISFGVAASLVAAIGVGGIWTLGSEVERPKVAETANSMKSRLIETAVGERLTVTLEDGSIVTLNTSSKLLVAFAPRRRDVTLLSGQALFRVAKDTNRPFVVKADDREIVAVGTEFEVFLQKRGIRVALLEGRVKIAPAGSPGNVASKLRRDQQVAMLEPGEEFVTHATSSFSVRTANVDALTSWRHGRVRFDDVPLDQAIEEMNRYSISKIRLADSRLSSLRVSGGFRTGQPQSFVAALSEVLPISAEETRGEIHLTHRP